MNTKIHRFLMVVAACFAMTPCFATVYYVDGDGGDDLKDGKSWSEAKQTFQAGINAAASETAGMHEVWVKTGTYKPGTERSSYFRLAKNVSVYGGFTGSETERDERDFEANPCILSGDIGVENDDSDNCYNVFVHGRGTDRTGVLDGFTITGGNANNLDGTEGGGAMYNGSESGPTLRNCVFTGNKGKKGGAMFNSSYASPELVNCTFSNNTTTSGGGAVANSQLNGAGVGPTVFSNCTFANNSAANGGAIHNVGSSPRFVDCSFLQNSAADTGGAVANGPNGRPKFNGCTFSENTCGTVTEHDLLTGKGGAVSNNTCGAEFTECTFTECSSVGYGGIIYCNRADVVLTNCDIEGNSAEYSGGAIYCKWTSTAEITNCLFADNTSDSRGGALHIEQSDSAIVGSTFSANTGRDGGAIYYENCASSLTNCTFAGNTAITGGGGILNRSGNSCEITNCTFVDNSAANGGAMLNEYAATLPVITNSIIWNSTGGEIVNNSSVPVITNSIIMGWSEDAEGNSGNNPGLGTLADNGGPVPTIAISSGSPAIDAGTPTNAPETDQRGVVREGNPDIGAYEIANFPPEAVAGALPEEALAGDVITLSGSGSHDFDDGPSPLTYQWTFLEAIPAEIVAPVLENADQEFASFTAGETGTYIFELTVYDGAASDTESVEVVIIPPQTITARAGTGGTVYFGTEEATSSATEEVRKGGTSSELYALGDTGFHFVRWNDGNTANPRRFDNVTSNISVTAEFEAEIFTITFEASEGGTLSGELSQTIAADGTGTPVTATADEGYVFEGWTIHGEVLTTEETMTVIHPQMNLTYVASFQDPSKSGSGSSGGGGGCSMGNSLPSTSGLLLFLTAAICITRTAKKRSRKA